MSDYSEPALVVSHSVLFNSTSAHCPVESDFVPPACVMSSVNAPVEAEVLTMRNLPPFAREGVPSVVLVICG